MINEGDLAHFIGTNNYYEAMGFYCTDGVKFLVEKCQCNWLIVAIASYQRQCMRDKMLRGIQFWTLEKGEGNSATLNCYRDANDLAFQQDIPYSDFFKYFSGDSVKLWVSNNVVMLPSEY